MNTKTSFFDELIKRRIFQIIGMYIAAVWLAVEISDWMNERFDISDIFSSIVFAGMLSFLPSVILLSWGHGRPGKDRWSKKELIGLPLNLIAAFFIVRQVIIYENQIIQSVPQTPLPVAASASGQNIEKKEIQNLTSNEFKEKKTINQNQSVISFFWDNESEDKSLDWLQYGAPWLVTQDLKRTPVLSVETPYDSRKMRFSMTSKGFGDALHIPLSLALQLANNQSAKWMILGSFEKLEDNIIFTARLIDVITGNEIESISETNQDLLIALDHISKRLNSLLHKHLPKSDNVIQGMAIAEHTSHNLQAIKELISAKNHVAFDNDYHEGIKDLMSALEMDNSFAEANVLAAAYYRSVGDIPNAIEQSKLALNLDYKVYQEKVYALKANLFGMSGDNNKALQALETWVKFYPSSAVGLATLGQNYLVSDQLDSAREIYEKLAEVGGIQDSLLNLGRIYRLQNEQKLALDALQEYVDRNPENAEAYIELADAYRQFMKLDKAREYYQQAVIIGNKNYNAEIGLAYVKAYEGDYVAAINQLYTLQNNIQNSSHIFQVQEALKSLYVQTGQINKALEIHQVQRKSAKEALNPLNYAFNMEGGEIELLILKGEFEKAIHFIEKLQKETQPPFNQIGSAYYLMVYEAMNQHDKYEKKLKEFEAFIQSFPIPYYEKIIYAWKAKAASWNKQYDLSDEYFNKALEYSKKSFVRLETLEVVDMIYYDKSLSLFEQKRYQESIEELDLILEHNPLYARAHYLKSKSYLELHDKEKAMQEINEARRIWKYADPEFVSLQKLNILEDSLTEKRQP